LRNKVDDSPELLIVLAESSLGAFARVATFDGDYLPARANIGAGGGGIGTVLHLPAINALRFL
jgi:hypothetical protein